MYISKRDFDIFRLLRWCRYVSKSMLETVFSPDEIACLIKLKIIAHHRSSDSLLLTQRGNQFVDQLDCSLPQSIQPSYRKSDTLRRLRRSLLMLTVYEAGLSLFHMSPVEIGCGDGFCLSSVTKGKGTNLWGSSRIAGILSVGLTTYAVHYVCPNIGRIALLHELNMLSIGASSLGKPRTAFMFVGETYEEVMRELEAEIPEPSKKRKNQPRIHYREAFEKNSTSVHILTCGQLGALQLKIMQHPDHYTMLAMYALGDAYEEPTREDDCDAHYKGESFYVGVDMNLTRLDRACNQGFIHILALEEQAVSVLIPRYAQTGRAKVYGIPPNVLHQFFHGEVSYYRPPEEPYQTKEGRVVHAPDIQAHTKSIDDSGEA